MASPQLEALRAALRDRDRHAFQDALMDLSLALGKGAAFYSVIDREMARLEEDTRAWWMEEDSSLPPIPQEGEAAFLRLLGRQGRN